MTNDSEGEGIIQLFANWIYDRIEIVLQCMYNTLVGQYMTETGEGTSIKIYKILRFSSNFFDFTSRIRLLQTKRSKPLSRKCLLGYLIFLIKYLNHKSMYQAFLRIKIVTIYLPLEGEKSFWTNKIDLVDFCCMCSGLYQLKISQR